MFFVHNSFLFLLFSFSLNLVLAGHYGISGVQTGIDALTGARPARRNIVDVQKDIPTWYEATNSNRDP